MKRTVLSALIGLSVFGTGAAGLIYQVVWERYVGRILGSDHVAIALTLAVFLGGLSLGYWLCGRLTLAVADHLRAYAILEGSIGVWALIFPSLFGGLESLTSSWRFAQPWGLLVQGLFVAGILILPPSLAMGATVPFLTRAISTLEEEVSSVHAAVYAVNTLGAFAGALLAAFVLVPAFGLPGALYRTAFVNLLTALLFAAFSRIRARSGIALHMAGARIRPSAAPPRSGAGARASSDLGRVGSQAHQAPSQEPPQARAAHTGADPETRTPVRASKPAVPGKGVSSGLLTIPPAVLYAISFLNGASMLSLETALIRLGKLVLGSSSYTFAMIISVFVLSIALGSFVVSRAKTLPRGALFGIQALGTLMLLVIYLTIDTWPYLAHLVRIGFQGGPIGFHLYYATLMLILVAAFLLPVSLLGATLPILFHELRAKLPESGWLSGRLLAWNGAGCLAGSLAGGFLLYTITDTTGVFLLTPLLAAVICVLAARFSGRGNLARAAATTLLVVCLIALVFRPFHQGSRLAFGTFRVRAPTPYSYRGPEAFYAGLYGLQRLDLFKEDALAPVAIFREARAPETAASGRGPAAEALTLVINGKSESDTVGDAATVRLLAHLPALWSGSRDQVFVIGLGTGVTAGEFSLYPDVRAIDVAEISPTVVSVLPRFSAFTHDIQANPRFRILPDDALLALRRDPRKRNIICSEPSNPWVSGVDQLFSREFYRLVRSRLTEDGVFIQWMHLYESDFEMLAMVLNTLREEFPVLHAFRGTEGDLLILASSRPFGPADLDRARSTLANVPAVQSSLREIGIPSIETILQREVTTLPFLLDQARRYEVNTMDHPRLHYLAGKALFAGSGVTEDVLQGRINPGDVRP